LAALAAKGIYTGTSAVQRPRSQSGSDCLSLLIRIVAVLRTFPDGVFATNPEEFPRKGVRVWRFRRSFFALRTHLQSP
jgi:hypothetical protein